MKTKTFGRELKENKQAAELQAIGRNAMACVAEMVAALYAPGLDDDSAREAIQQDALSVEVRSDWHEPGEKNLAPAEYTILLSTGGPATRIIGALNEHGEPTSAQLEAQDWFTPWTAYHDADESVLLAYASVFYYGQ